MDASVLKYMAFVKTVEYGSFTKAAEALNYSQAGISRMIKDLERDWNITLLERSRTGVRLTSDGMKLLPRAQSVCTEYKKLEMDVDELNGIQMGLIRIGSFSNVATHWIPNIILAFQKDYPNIDFELLVGDYAQVEEWILDGRVDCGFLRVPTHPDFDITMMEHEPLLAVIPENHPLSALEEIPLAALCESPFILLGHGNRSEITEIFSRNGLKPNVRYTTWDEDVIISLVECGLGVSILPRLALKRCAYRVQTKALDVPAYRDIGLAIRRGSASPLAVLRMLDYLKYR